MELEFLLHSYSNFILQIKWVHLEVKKLNENIETGGSNMISLIQKETLCVIYIFRTNYIM